MRFNKYVRRGGPLEKDPFKLGSTSKSRYYPFYCLSENLRRVGSEFIYSFPSLDIHYNMLGRYDDLFNTLHQGSRGYAVDKFEFVYSDINRYVFVDHHIMVDTEGRILMIMTFDDKSFFTDELSYMERLEKLDNFKLFVSTRLMLEDKYTNLWKKVEKDYVSQCYKNGVEVEFTTSEKIYEKVFSNSFSLVSRDMDSFMQHLREDVPQIFMEAIEELSREEESEEELEVNREISTNELTVTFSDDIRVASGGTNISWAYDFPSDSTVGYMTADPVLNTINFSDAINEELGSNINVTFADEPQTVPFENDGEANSN